MFLPPPQYLTSSLDLKLSQKCGDSPFFLSRQYILQYKGERGKCGEGRGGDDTKDMVGVEGIGKSEGEGRKQRRETHSPQIEGMKF